MQFLDLKAIQIILQRRENMDGGLLENIKSIKVIFISWK